MNLRDLFNIEFFKTWFKWFVISELILLTFILGVRNEYSSDIIFHSIRASVYASGLLVAGVMMFMGFIKQGEEECE